MSQQPMAEAAALPSHLPDPLNAMQRTLQLAEQAIGLSEPNPRVGCIITAPDGRVLGQGHTQAAGQAHAEVMALRDAQARGHEVKGATAYVSLEPCAHHGRTPPCCDALIAAGLARVHVAIEDPNPLVAGQGLARLRAAGIETSLGCLEAQARELNIGFFSRMQRARPFVRLKAAISLDGRTALDSGLSQWITAEPARADGHHWRRRAGAVLTGIGTVLHDDPRMDVRVPTALQPLRVVLDSQLRLPPTARILQPPGTCLVLTSPPLADVEAWSRRQSALQEAGAEVLALPRSTGQVGPGGSIDLSAVLSWLGQRGINELHVEAGQQLNASFLQGGWVDELLVYVAPKLLGPGLGLAGLPPLASLTQVSPWHWHDVAQLGTDLRLRLRPGAAA